MMTVANGCPAKGRERCTGELCGHCRACGRPLDEHNGLTVAPPKP